MKKKKKKRLVVTRVTFEKYNNAAYEAHWNAAFCGDREALAALGLPVIAVHSFPVSFVNGDYKLDPKTKCISQHRLPEIKPGDDMFDVVAFFEELFNQGRLPVDTPNDARRLVMAIASPFLRDIAPGLLGVFWFVGPSGAGKDFLASIVSDIWLVGMVHMPQKASFELRDVDDGELQKVFFAAGDAPYARAKEAGKTQAKILRLIQLAGTEHVTKRGHYLHEVQAHNTYTFLADSAEDLPDKKEISRRTVAINVEAVDGTVSLGEVRAEILAKAPDILRSLKRLIETKPATWYLNQDKTDLRPVVPVALSRLLQVDLDDVSGRDLSQIFDVMAEYQNQSGVVDIGWEQQRRMKLSSRKGTMLETEVPSYPYAHFVETMSQDQWVKDEVGPAKRVPRGYKTLLREFDTHNKLRKTLDTEMGYKRVGRRMKYLPVTVAGAPYAFRFVGSSNQNFVLMHEVEFCKATKIEPITPSVETYLEQEKMLEQQTRDELKRIKEKETEETGKVLSFSDDREDEEKEKQGLDEINKKYEEEKTRIEREYDHRLRELKAALAHHQ